MREYFREEKSVKDTPLPIVLEILSRSSATRAAVLLFLGLVARELAWRICGLRQSGRAGGIRTVGAIHLRLSAPITIEQLHAANPPILCCDFPPVVSTTPPRTTSQAKIRSAKRPRKRNVFKGFLSDCGETQPPIPTFTDHGRLRWIVSASRTQ